jgi:hypothetical protein
MVGSFEVPRSEHGDSDDVVVSLETARVQAEKRNTREAIRWIRRAAQAAENSGDDGRASALAAAAQELTSLLRQSRARAHSPVQDLEQPLPFDDEEDKTAVNPKLVDEEHAAEDPTEPGTRHAETGPAMPAPESGSGFQHVQALRVAVDPLAPGSRILVVHLLADGESAGQGRREAVLIAADPKVRLLSR